LLFRHADSGVTVLEIKNHGKIMNKKILFGMLLAAVVAGQAAVSRADEISPEGKKLIAALDAMHVDKLWLAGAQVDWRTGETNGKVFAVPNGHTHCSAFAAAAAERLGVYLLRPPEHSATLLANAQQDWLCSKGTNNGWLAVSSPIEAQKLANAGNLVVVTCKNPDATRPGHIAIVRPSEKSEKKILAEGPEITQAGLHNYNDSSTLEGFKNHKGAFEGHKLLYFAHPVFFSKLDPSDVLDKTKSPGLLPTAANASGQPKN
jgi:hypothetical protein